MPFIKFIIVTLILTSLSFSESEIINPFSNPSVILRNSQQIETQSTYQEENTPSSSTADIINPFSDPHVIKGYSQQEENNDDDDYSSSSDADIINPFSNPSIVLKGSQNVELNTPSSKGRDTPYYQPAKNQAILDARALPSSKNSASFDTVAPDIQGKYRLVQGTKSFGSGVRKMMEEGYLVIEKLNDNNFGYYYAFSVEKSSPLSFFGIFNYDKGEFHQRVIKDEGALTTENLTNTKIVTNGNQLGLDVNIEGGSVSSMWEYDSSESFSPKIQKSLNEAKKDYKEIYKDKFSQLKY